MLDWLTGRSQDKAINAFLKSAEQDPMAQPASTIHRVPAAYESAVDKVQHGLVKDYVATVLPTTALPPEENLRSSLSPTDCGGTTLGSLPSGRLAVADEKDITQWEKNDRKKIVRQT